jgi:hypothetical protein
MERTSSAQRSVLVMERDIVNGINEHLLSTRWGHLFSVALEGIAEAARNIRVTGNKSGGGSYSLCLSSKYCMAILPSTLPTANPFPFGKHAIARVCILSGEDNCFRMAQRKTLINSAKIMRMRGI